MDHGNSSKRRGRHRLRRADCGTRDDGVRRYFQLRGLVQPASPGRIAAVARRAAGRADMSGRAIRAGDALDHAGQWIIAATFWLCASIVAVLLVGALVLLIV